MTLKLFQGSWRKLLKLKRPAQDYHLAAGIPRVENPASSLAELQLSVPLHSFISNSFFFREPPCHSSVPQKSYLVFDRQQYPSHPQVHCFDTSFLKTVLYCFYCLFVFMNALYVFRVPWFKVLLCDKTCLKKGTKITSYRLTVNLSLNFIATAQAAGDETHREKLFFLCSVQFMTHLACMFGL